MVSDLRRSWLRSTLPYLRSVWLMADLLRWARSCFEPIIDEKLDFFFLCVLAKDCISKVLLMMFEVLVIYFDLQLFMCRSTAEPSHFVLRWAMQQLCVDFSKDQRLSLLSLLWSNRYPPFLFLQEAGSRRLLVRSGTILMVFSLLLLLRLRELSFLTV